MFHRNPTGEAYSSVMVPYQHISVVQTSEQPRLCRVKVDGFDALRATSRHISALHAVQQANCLTEPGACAVQYKDEQLLVTAALLKGPT